MKSVFILAFGTLFIQIQAQQFERLYPTSDLGTVESINIHPSGQGFAPQECGYMLKTQDGGLSWQPHQWSLNTNSHFSSVVPVDEADDAKWVYQSQYELVKTSNNFESFTHIKPNNVSGLMNDFEVLSDGTWALLANEFYYSSDQGVTWTKSQTPEVQGLDLHEHKGNLYAVFREVMRSADGGQTFQTVFSTNEILRKVVHIGDTLFVSSSNNLYRSVDNGLTWEDVEAQDYYGSADNLVAHDGLLLANTSNRINYSSDHGKTWTSVIMPAGIFRTRCLFVAPDGRMLIGGEANQIYTTTDVDVPLTIIHGSLESYEHIVSNKMEVIAMGQNGSVARSTDGGVSWAEHRILDEQITQGFYVENDLYFLAGNGKMYRLNDVNQAELLHDFGADIWSAHYSPVTQMIYAANQNQLFTSADKGTTWSSPFNFTEEVQRIMLSDEGMTYALTEGGLLYKINENGASWAEVLAGENGHTYLDAYVHNDVVVYLLSSSTVFLTKDGGNSFESNSRPYNGSRLYKGPGEAVLCLGVNSSDGWLYASDGESVNFSLVDATCGTISRQAFFDEENQIFYACGAGKDIERVDFNTSSLNANKVQEKPILVFPNPADHVVYFPHPLSNLRLSDSFGQVSRMEGETISLDIIGLPAGLYFIRGTAADGRQYSASFIKL